MFSIIFNEYQYSYVELKRVSSKHMQLATAKISLQIQSKLIISNLLVSNYRLSRSENLVPVLTWNYDNR